MLKVGTLVKYKHDGDIGLVMNIEEDHGHLVYWVKWSDGSYHHFVSSEFEVLS